MAVGTSGSEGKSEQPRTEAAMLGHLLDMGFEVYDFTSYCHYINCNRYCSTGRAGIEGTEK